jgi:hypothetical protein
MMSRACLLLLPLLAFAQELAPPDVDQALRARVTGFYQNFMEGSFSPRKAEEFIAEDTKDYFYNAGKQRYISFKVDKITYSSDFAKADVMVLAKGTKVIAGHIVVMDLQQPTRWKIEGGKWCWTYDPCAVAATPMGGSPCATGAGGDQAKGRGALVSVTPEAIQGRGAQIAKVPMGVDKSEVSIRSDVAGSAKVTFTNGADGGVQIAMAGPAVRGLKATLDITTVPAHGTAVLTLQYDPADKRAAADAVEAKGRVPLQIVVEPFDRIYPVNVVFSGAAK